MNLSSHKWSPYKHGSISLCVITKNEETLLERMISSVQGLVKEIILVDTGSTDHTIEIAKKLGARVFKDPWQDDFARPRNIATSHATCDYILSLDPDEVIGKQDHYLVRRCCGEPSIIAWQVGTRNYTRSRIVPGLQPYRNDYPEVRGWPGFKVSTKTRLWQNGYNIKWRGCWHELPDYDVMARHLPVRLAPWVVHHFEHESSHITPLARRKLYLRLGEKKVREDPDDNQGWWELAVAENIEGFNLRALRSVLMSMRGEFANTERLFFLAQCYRRLGRPKEGTWAFEKAICKLYPQLTHIEPSMKATYYSQEGR